MPGVPRQQARAVQFHPGVGLEWAGGWPDAEQQLWFKAAAAQPAIGQQRLAQAGGIDQAVATGDGGEAGELSGRGEFFGAGGMGLPTPAQCFDHAAGALVAGQCQHRVERGQPDRTQGEDAALRPRQLAPAVPPATHLRPP